MIHLTHRTKFDPKSAVFKVSHLRGGRVSRVQGGLNPNETLSHSNGKFVFDHVPKLATHPKYSVQFPFVLTTRSLQPVGIPLVETETQLEREASTQGLSTNRS